VYFEPATEDFLYDLVGGHPFALQVACFHAFDTGGDHAETERRALRELEAHFQYTWHNLTLAEQAVLRDLGSLHLRALAETALRSLLRDLVQKCLLMADSQGYHYPARAWAEFVAAQLPEEHPHTTIAVAHQTVRRRAAGELRSGALLGSYEVQEQLGRGGMSEVYLGHHTRLNRPVAIKVLAAAMAGYADFRERFEREARAVAALSHPNIVQVYDFGDVDGLYYMVMEYIGGSDLACHLAERGPLPLAEVRLLAGDIAAALDYAHGRGVIHRDIKPSNVMLRNGGAVLADFGIAKVLAGGEAAATRAGMLVGTPDYMAPEQIRGAAELDARADIYAFGVMLFQLLTGRLPFVRSHAGEVVQAHLHHPAPDPRILVPTLPTPAAQAIMQALAKNPAERPATAGQLAAALSET
jgi:predicted Ser/Thr protein kinase